MIYVILNNTLHELIKSQSVHLSGAGLGMNQTHAGRAANDIEYLDALFKGLLDIYRKAP